MPKFRNGLISICVSMAVQVGMPLFALAESPYSPKPGSEQKTFKNELGTEYLLSVKQNSAVAVTTGYGNGSSIIFVVSVTNYTKDRLLVDPANFSVKSGTRIVQIKTPEDYEREASRKAFWTSLGAGLAMAGNSMNAANAGYSTSTTSYSGSASAFSGGRSAYGTYTGTSVTQTYDAGAAYNAQQYANARNNDIQARAEEQIAQIKSQGPPSGLFIPMEVFPGGTFTGYVFPKGLRGKKVSLDISTGGELHHLEFER
jgi:hypothetical protein